jgi:uncharacterized cupredoxin-like copper-binding protein
VPPRCTICDNKKRCAIDQCVIDGGSLRHIASQFNIGYKSLERHIKSGHIDQAIKAADHENRIKHGKTLFERIQYLQNLALDEALEAKKDKDRRGFAACLAVAAKSHDTEAKITIPENKNVNLTVTNQSDIDERLAQLAERRNTRKSPTDS